jgi:hypothetical protein
MFSTLLIHECGLHLNQPISFSFKVSPSFPSLPWKQENKLPAPDSWAPKDISNASGCLELKLQTRIAEGRTGVTFSAQVISATMDGGGDILSSMPPTVCLKFAKQEFCRSLAREAWMYERLEKCQGTSIPQCYGFFSSKMGQQSHSPHTTTFVPWEDRIYSFEETDEGPPPIWSPSPDWLPDDDGHSADDCDDPVRTESLWNTWQRDNNDPTLAVLVLELLGEPCDGRRSFKDKYGLAVVTNLLLANFVTQGGRHGSLR